MLEPSELALDRAATPYPSPPALQPAQANARRGEWASPTGARQSGALLRFCALAPPPIDAAGSR
jgi:hypothetical protein